MAAFDRRAFEGANGAVRYLQEKAPKAARLALASGVVVSEKGSRALLVSLVAAHGMGPDSALNESIRVAQESLDHWAVMGVMARTLAAVDDEHILWWEGSDGTLACRIWTTTRLNPTFEVRAEVRDSKGNVVPPKPVPEWHPSFRFFRLGQATTDQATTDLVDAFRNYYLALEAILSTIEPMGLRQDGRPAERETDWLNRALLRAATFVDFTEYAASGASGDPIDAIRTDIYAGARTRTFHAKIWRRSAPAARRRDSERIAGFRDTSLTVVPRPGPSSTRIPFSWRRGSRVGWFLGHGLGSRNYAVLRLG